MDVIVVGGGIVGCSTAYFCAREGMGVTLLERRTIGYGASGRNPGWLWLHCRTPGFALDVSRAGRKLYPELLAELPGGFEFRPSGGLMYFMTPDQGAVFEAFVAARQADGLDIELIDGAEVRRLVPPIRDDVLGASYCSEDAQIVTSTVVEALIRGARAEGATIREDVAVERLILDGERVVGVETDGGRFTGDAVVIATGAWTTRLLAPAGIDVPIGGERLQLVSTVPQPQFWIEPLVYGPNATKQYALFRDLPSWDPGLFTTEGEDHDGLTFLPLLVQRASGEVLLGCATDYPDELDPEPTLAGLAQIATGFAADFPALRNVPITRAWAGILPFTSDQAPVIDEVMPGLFVGAGHAFGNTSGPVTGRVLSQLIAGREPDFDISECRHGRPLDPIAVGAPTHW
ncbi:MAG TPA: FAD-binding oxidoreductase [Candidatus Limnocylindrales bacterium]|nr:FAD-binding oxidoreductase [Candidatus Limnocylindrales bacterium]